MQFTYASKVSSEKLWQEFSNEHATIEVLRKRYALNEKTIRRTLDRYHIPESVAEPRTMVAVMDATKVGRLWVLAIRDPHRQETVYAHEISIESTSAYQVAYDDLKQKGFSICAIVSDGRFVALPWLFPGIPIQMCHFHQEQIIIRYLTLNPKLEAGIELLALARTLPRTDEASFTDAFKLWCTTHHDFLQEKTIDEQTGKWHWKHKRLRQARDSITRHLPFLFTFQTYPTLNIPNTTNSLDGTFKKGKMALGIHAGLTQARQMKLFLSILFARS